MADDDKPRDRTDRKAGSKRGGADQDRPETAAFERDRDPELRDPDKAGKARRRKRRKNRDKDRRDRGLFGGLESFEDYMRMTMDLCRDPSTAGMAGAVAETMLATIATGPSFAGMQTMVSANQANSLMYYNAVANQQMGNIVGMVTTMNCVQVLLGKQDDLVAMPDFAVASGLGARDVG